MRKYLISCMIFAIIQIPYSYACSAPPRPSVKDAFNESTDVYLAVAVSIKNSPKSFNKKSKQVDQEVTFKVLETWKGSNKEGDTIKFNTSIFSGGCGVSANNNPPWLENELPDVKTGKIAYVKMSGIWLIYEKNNEPHSLIAKGRTAPFEYGGVYDMKELYKLILINET